MRGVTVVGCVHGAWRDLQARLGPAAPTYERCEDLWRSSPHRTVPVDHLALARWIEAHLDAPEQMSLGL